MNRRSLLKLSLIAPVFWLFFQSSTKAGIKKNILTKLHQKLRNLPHLKSWQFIGEEYLKLYPEDADMKHLLTGLTNQLAIPGEQQIGNDWYQSIQAKITEDFQNQKTVQIDGWILAKTEAQLCALTTKF